MTDLRQALEADPEFAARYALGELLGQGGFARVFRGTQRSTGQAVAVKALEAQPGSARDAAGRAARFRREMELCAGLHHPHVVHLIDAGVTASGCLWGAFDYVPGRSLDRVLAEDGPLDPAEATRLLAQVLDAIGAAHRQGVVHRDLKPSNVMVSDTGLLRNALVLDFGIGTLAEELRERGPRLTASGEALGTPSYAAPEQLRGETPTARSDLYSWGLTALECLTGEPAIRGASLQEVLASQLSDEPVAIPDAVRALPIGRAVAAALAKRAEERAASAQELLRILLEDTRSPLDLPPSHASARERKRQITALSLRARWGGEEEASLERREARLRSLQETVLESVREHGGTVVARVGSRVVAVFGYPRAREEAARAALQAAAAAREAVGARGEPVGRASLRAGVHSGVVIAPEAGAASAGWDPLGSAALDVAMELETRARDGEILVSDATRLLLRGPAPLEPAGDIETGGSERTLAVHRLTGGPADLRKRPAGGAATPLVGRGEELARLSAAWQRAREGAPQARLVSGEAGIGKSRLLRELSQHLDERAWIECRCTPEAQHTPFQPIVDWLSDWVRASSLEQILGDLELDLAESHPLLSELLGLPPDPRWPPRPLASELRRERTMKRILDLLFAAAKRHPLAFVVEDLHWADPTTLDLLAALVQEIRSTEIFDAAPDLPLLVLLSARPDFEPPWPAPEVPLVQLGRLNRQEAETLARAATRGAAAFSAEALDQIVRRADGVPLFLEEMGRMMSETGAPGAASADPREVPATLHDLLSARIDRLHADVRRTAQAAACLGRDFDFPLLRSVSDRPEALIRDDLETLIRAGLVFRRSRAKPDRYLFHHSLLRDLAHDSMLVEDRRGVHQRVAQSLQGPGFEEVASQQPERLAYHCEEAGLVDRAIDFRRRAGRRALARSADREAIHHFGRALDLLLALPESAERDEQELDIQLATGSAYTTTRGYAAEPVERSFERALDLCNRLPQAPRLFGAVNGLWGYHLVRGEPHITRALVERQRELAGRSTRAAEQLMAAHADGTTAFYCGDFARALPRLTEAVRLYEEVFEAHLARDGARPWRNPASSAPMYLGWCLHLVGRPEQGLAKQNWGLAQAERLREAFVHVEAMTHLVALLHDRREPARTLELSDRIVALSEELGFRFWLGIGKSARGWARSQLGEVEPGTTEIEEGLEIFERTGSMVPLVYRLSYLAEAHLAARRSDAGLAAIDDALARSAGRLDRFYDAEMFRLRGELLRQKQEPAAAEAEFERALGLARTQGARLFELRAVASLARLHTADGRRTQARDLLEPVYRGFEEGFDTPDLRDAAALLAELGST